MLAVKQSKTHCGHDNDAIAASVSYKLNKNFLSKLNRRVLALRRPRGDFYARLRSLCIGPVITCADFVEPPRRVHIAEIRQIVAGLL